MVQSLTLPSREEMLELTKEMYEASTTSTTRKMLKPHGYLLDGEDLATSFAGGEGGEVANRVHALYHLKKIMATENAPEPDFMFSMGISWGYYRDDIDHAKVVHTSVEEYTGVPADVASKCTLILSMEVGKDSALGLICWVTGCYIGHHLRNLAEMMEGLK